jgi:hypothetical protein
MSTTTLAIGPARKTMCYSGGGYFRLLPLSLITQGMEREAAAGRPTVVYLHPRDFAVDCPRPRMPLHRAFKCFVGLGTTGRKLTHLLERYAWTTCGEVLRAHGCWPEEGARPAEAAGPERRWQVVPDLPLDRRARPPRITQDPPPPAWPPDS